MSKQRIWSRKIFAVVEHYVSNPGTRLFGITGDLDNLGMYVSKNGRPLAENLVDVYNRLIGAFMYSFTNKHRNKIPRFCMIPSGEEIFSIGTITDISVARKFFGLLATEVNNFIHANAPFSSDDVKVSFGCKIFPNKNVRPVASAFAEAVRHRRVKEASAVYLNLMLMMRRELAYELDRAKFLSLNASELDLVVLFRNVVYAKLREYKEGTKKALLALAEEANNDSELREKLRSLALNSKYGITDDDVAVIIGLLSKKNPE
ncbi:hypothetical protein CO157_05330 [Candidatus Peregrinibacteria bacterium CG_4_9_14_3_um_filter_49_12]|nr:MAG: hypothetical protein CO157_05330 [Candidatus Peregrinibacteria bacterium CG_4_9_14_3_um_filter_49_12]